MLKKTITYEDFDENKVTDTLYFNVTKTELSANLNLVKSFEGLQEMFQEKHDLSTEEIMVIFNFVQTLMRLSYGIKSPDGKSFEKSEALWLKFMNTAAYDAFTMSLFENPQEANDFMIAIFPKELLAQAKLQMAAGDKTGRPVPLDHQEKQLSVVKPVDERAALEARLASLNAEADANKPVIQ
jgi:hypothetical protein